MEPINLKRTLKIPNFFFITLLFCSLSIAVPLYNSDIPEEATSIEASIGGYAVLDCHLDFPFGNEIPYHLQWDKNGEWILSWYSGDGEPSIADRYMGRLARVGAGIDGLGRGSVNVSAIREADAGLYRCTVSFPNRTPPTRNNGTFYNLEVNGSNLIVSPPVNATVLEGEAAELECQPKTPDSSVQWYKDGTPVESLKELFSRITIGENGSLVIPKTEITDPGEYSCNVTDKDGMTQTASAVLDVQYKAKVVYAPHELYLPFGKAASLDCHFSANPPLTNLRWEKDGFLFDPYNVPGVFYSRNGSLLFNKVDESHEGSYSCTPYNALGSMGASPRVHVRVLRPPSLRAPPAPLYLPRLGDTLTVPCHPEIHDHDRDQADSPPFQIYWTRKDGVPLPPHRWSLSGGNLTITNVSATDGGQYICVIQNEANAATATTELRIENLPPRAPQTLTAVPAARSVKLRWKPGQSHVETEYTIWYRQRSAPEWRTIKLLSLGVTEATVLDLRPSTEYELRVLAQDPIGDGLFSRPIFVTTLEEHNEGNDTGVAVTPVTQSAGQMAPLEVAIRLVGSGALVTWGRPGSGEAEYGSAGSEIGSNGDESLCAMRVYTGTEQTLAHDKQTHDHYAMIPSVTEGERYWVQVECEASVGSASLQVHLNIHEYPTYCPGIQSVTRGVGWMRSGRPTPGRVGHRTLLGKGPAVPTTEQLAKPSPKLVQVDNVTAVEDKYRNTLKDDKLTMNLISNIDEATTKLDKKLTDSDSLDNILSKGSQMSPAVIPIQENVPNSPFKVDMLATPIANSILTDKSSTTSIPKNNSNNVDSVNSLETKVNKLLTTLAAGIQLTDSPPTHFLTSSIKEDTVALPTTVSIKDTLPSSTKIVKYTTVPLKGNSFSKVTKVKSPLSTVAPQPIRLSTAASTKVDNISITAKTVNGTLRKNTNVNNSTKASIEVNSLSTQEEIVATLPTMLATHSNKQLTAASTKVASLSTTPITVSKSPNVQMLSTASIAGDRALQLTKIKANKLADAPTIAYRLLPKASAQTNTAKEQRMSTTSIKVDSPSTVAVVETKLSTASSQSKKLLTTAAAEIDRISTTVESVNLQKMTTGFIKIDSPQTQNANEAELSTVPPGSNKFITTVPAKEEVHPTMVKSAKTALTEHENVQELSTSPMEVDSPSTITKIEAKPTISPSFPTSELKTAVSIKVDKLSTTAMSRKKAQISTIATVEKARITKPTTKQKLLSVKEDSSTTLVNSILTTVIPKLDEHPTLSPKHNIIERSTIVDLIKKLSTAPDSFVTTSKANKNISMKTTETISPNLDSTPKHNKQSIVTHNPISMELPKPVSSAEEIQETTESIIVVSNIKNKDYIKLRLVSHNKTLSTNTIVDNS